MIERTAGSERYQRGGTIEPEKGVSSATENPAASKSRAASPASSAGVWKASVPMQICGRGADRSFS
jgi:hypothetical protein